MMHPLAYVAFIAVEAMFGAYLGCIVVRREHGWTKAAIIVLGMCDFAVIAYYLPLALLRESRWSYALIVLALAVTAIVVWGVWERFSRETSPSGFRYRGRWRCLGLAAILGVWWLLYTGPAATVRFWVLSSTAHALSDGSLEFRLVEHPDKKVVLFPRSGAGSYEYVESLRGASVPLVFYKPYTFGVPAYGAGNLLVVSIGSLSEFDRLTFNFDGRFAEQLPSLDRAGAEQVIGRRFDNSRFH